MDWNLIQLLKLWVQNLVGGEEDEKCWINIEILKHRIFICRWILNLVDYVILLFWKTFDRYSWTSNYLRWILDVILLTCCFLCRSASMYGCHFSKTKHYANIILKTVNFYALTISNFSVFAHRFFGRDMKFSSKHFKY